MNKGTKIICGFAGIGKSTLFKDEQFSSQYTVLDSDSSKFDRKFFPHNYIKHIKDNIGTADYIFTSCHKEVIDALIREGLKFVIVYPSINRRSEFINNYRNRGNDQNFINKLISNWEIWINDIIKREDCYTHCLLNGEYLIDAINDYIKDWKFINNYPAKIEEKDKIYTFAVDFDGTCITDCFPAIGEEIGAVEVLLELQQKGHKIILNTVRSNHTGDNLLDEAIDWFNKHKISLYGINENPDQKSWSSSLKVHADYFIDDKSIGMPLIIPAVEENKLPYVDWLLIRKFLIEKGIL